MTEIWEGVKSERHPEALAKLAAEARRDLSRLNFPAANWVPPSTRDSKPVLDVLVLGAGLCGQTAAFVLMRDGIRNVRIVDRCPKGEEGPWGTYARMQILRSPKTLSGPDLGVPSLTFRAWYEAQHGEAGWQRLHKAGRLDWRDYLIWVRETVGIRVENGVEVIRLAPEPDGVAVTLRSAAGTEQVFARKVVLASGRDGSGGLRLPSFPGLVAAGGGLGRCLHSSQDIDFLGLANRRIAVLGSGASAFDCAATALEAGAAQVTLFVRRPHLPQVNKAKWASFIGCLRGFSALDDATRWQFFTYISGEQAPPPHESVLRCDAHAAFSIRFCAPWTDVCPDTEGVTMRTPQGDHRADMAILATGFDVDLTMRSELELVRDNILLWRDRISPEAAARVPECARFPYVGPGFEMMERTVGATPGLGHMHVFNWGVTVSHGALAGDIPGLRIGADRLAEALCRALLGADIATHLQRLHDAEDPELLPTKRFVPRERRNIAQP